jgi:exopolysaccharide production protein ExoY
MIIGEAWISSRSKRMVDIIGVLLALPFLILLVLVMIILVVVIDRSTPLFSQSRIGKGGTIFKFYKINTMGRIRSNDYGRGAHDDRATPLGRILRIAILDEVPQILINILRGDMGLVGPRPLLQADVDLMKARLDSVEYERWFAAYSFGRPGWTGKFGLESRRFVTQSDEYLRARLKQDVKYRYEATLRMDIAIIFIHAILPFLDMKRQRTAYAASDV